MRRRLEGVEEEYDLKVNELQGDISSLRNILQQTEVHTKQAEREKSLLITQLTEQNQRLTSQLKDVSRKEDIQKNSFKFCSYLELQNRRISYSRIAVNERPGVQQEDKYVRSCSNPGDSQGRDNNHD